MRQYPQNSPAAMSRLVALSLMADGAIDLSELDTLERQDILSRVGMDESGFDKVIHEFCEDMLTCANRNTSGQIELDEATVGALLTDINEPALQRRVLRAMLDIVNADGRLSGGEAVLVSQAMKSWDIDLYEVSQTSKLRARRWPPQVRRPNYA